MSEENVQVVRLGYERLNNGDINGVLELCDPDIEFRDLPELPDSGVFIGHDGVRDWLAKLLDTSEDLRFEPEELIEAPGDRVVAVNHASARGKGSGAEVEMHFSSVWTLRDGKVIRHFAYSDHAQALQAAGLSE